MIKFHPSVRNLPISEKRRDRIISTLISTFNNWALSRRMVNVRNVSSGEDFVKLGLNLILDKIWFVDYVGEEFYAYEGLGYMEGQSIALSETRLIAETILRSAVAENRKDVSELTEESLLVVLAQAIRDRGDFAYDTIISNVHDGLKFWGFKFFKGVPVRDSPFGLEGYYNGIPVYWSNSIPQKCTILVNKSIGELLIKQDIWADISEIKEEEVKEVLKSIPSFNEEELKEKIRLKVFEVIRFDLKNKEAITIINSKA